MARHAHATRVDVHMGMDGDTMWLKVQDNGKGITGTKIHGSKSLGFLGMRERVLPFDGTIDIHGQRGKGTTVTIRIPMGAPTRRAHAEQGEGA